jgi:hypothetical protein
MPLAASWPAGTHWVPGDANAPADCAHEKGLQTQAFSRAAEGIRTLDLLHGKQNVTRCWLTRYCCKCAVSPSKAAADDPRLSPRNHGGLRTESGLSKWGRRAPGRPSSSPPWGTAVVSAYGGDNVALLPGGPVAKGRMSAGSVEHVAKARAVAEALELAPERRAVGAVLRAGHVADVGLPAAWSPATL